MFTKKFSYGFFYAVNEMGLRNVMESNKKGRADNSALPAIFRLLKLRVLILS